MVSASVPNVSAARANSVAHRDGYVHEGQLRARLTCVFTRMLTVLQEVAKVYLLVRTLYQLVAAAATLQRPVI